MLSALFLAAAAPALASAFDLGADTSPDGLIRFPLTVSTGAPVVKGVTKRQNEVALESQQNGFFYSIDVTLGTPGQKVTVNLDTGSAELWVNPVCDKAQQPSFCSQFGHFGESSTFVNLNTTGGVVYGTGYAYWNYGYDSVVIGCEYPALPVAETLLTSFKRPAFVTKFLVSRTIALSLALVLWALVLI